MPSASPSPMSWSARSEYRSTSFALSAATVELPVRSDGVWHNAQPVSTKSFLPLEMESAPPGSSCDGVGGARKRMKDAIFQYRSIHRGRLDRDSSCHLG